MNEKPYSAPLIASLLLIVGVLFFASALCMLLLRAWNYSAYAALAGLGLVLIAKAIDTLAFMEHQAKELRRLVKELVDRLNEKDL